MGDEHASRKNCTEGSSSTWISTYCCFARPRPLYKHKRGDAAAHESSSSASKTLTLKSKASICEEQFLAELYVSTSYFTNSASTLLTGKCKNTHNDYLLSKSHVEKQGKY